MDFCDEWVLKLKWFGAMRTIGPEKTDTCVREIGAKEIQDFGRSTHPIFGATGDSSMDPDLQEACSTRIPIYGSEPEQILEKYQRDVAYIGVRG